MAGVPILRALRRVAAAVAVATAVAAVVPVLAGAAGLVLTPAGVDFGAVAPSTTSSVPVVVTNGTGGPVTLTGVFAGTGPGSPGAFSVDPSGCMGSPTLAAGASCSVLASYTAPATGVGPAVGHLDVATTAAGTWGAPLVANGAPLPGGPSAGPLSASPNPFSVLTSPGVGTVHFTNPGPGTVAVTGVAIHSGPSTPSTDFLVIPATSSCVVLPVLGPGASCTVDFSLIAGAIPGVHAALIVDSSSGPSVADLTYGTAGPPPGIAHISPSAFSFGAVEVGVPSAPATFTVTNDSGAPLALAPALAGPSYAVTGGTCGATLAVAASCTYNVRFTPDHMGAMPTSFDVVLNGGPALVHADLSGNGITLGTAASVTPSPATFPTTLVGSTSLPLTFTWANIGIHTLVWAGGAPGLSPDFTITGGTCMGVGYLLPGGTCTAVAVFNPTGPGLRTASLTPGYNGPPVPLVLNGVGAVIQAGAGSQGGGYVVVGGPNVEANRDRFEWAVRVRADGLVYGKVMTYRFTEGGVRYVARLAIGAIPFGMFTVAGTHASFEGPATLASVAGTVETPVAGSWYLRVESDDLIPGSNNGAGFDRVAIQLSFTTSGLFHATGSPSSPAVITSGAVGNAYPWIA